MVDGNAAYTLGSALQMGEVLHDLRFDFFEEPLPQVAPHYAGYEELRSKLPLPLAGAKGSTHGPRRKSSSTAARSTSSSRTSASAAASAKSCSSPNWPPSPASRASLTAGERDPDRRDDTPRLAPPRPALGFSDRHPDGRVRPVREPWRTEIVEQPITVKEGFIQVSDAPGLGLQIREEVVRKYAV